LSPQQRLRSMCAAAENVKSPLVIRSGRCVTAIAETATAARGAPRKAPPPSGWHRRTGVARRCIAEPFAAVSRNGRSLGGIAKPAAPRPERGFDGAWVELSLRAGDG
jgi:hypothetical protein